MACAAAVRAVDGSRSLARARLLESRRADALFIDPYAELLVQTGAPVGGSAA